MRTGLVWAATTLVLGLSIGCTTQNNTTPGSSGSSGSGTTTAAPPGLSCLQVLECVVACPESDTACPDACGEKGTPQAKTDVTALAACIDREKCEEGTCTKTKCASELDVCLSSSAPAKTGTELSGDAPPGSVPADLVGTWAGARNGITERLVFNADGTGSWQSTVASSQSTCLSFVRTLRTGNVVITDKTITVYATSVVEQKQTCSPPTADSEQSPTTEVIEYSRSNDGTQLLIVDSACAAKYPEAKNNCDTAGCPIGLYCTSRLDRE